MRKEFLEVGEIVTIHGVRGYFRLYPWCDDGDLDDAKFMYLNHGNVKYEVEDVKAHKNVYLVKWKGIDTPEEAVKLRGQTVYMHRNDIRWPRATILFRIWRVSPVVDKDDPGIVSGFFRRLPGPEQTISTA